MLDQLRAVKRRLRTWKRNSSRQPREGPVLGDLAGGVEKAAPRRAGERPANADPSDAEFGQFGDGREVAADQHVHRLRRNGLDDRRDLLSTREARCIQAVGPSLGIGRETTDRLGEVRASDNESFRPGGEQNAGAALIDRPAGRTDALDRERELEERLRFISRRVLDRQAGDAGRRRDLDVARDIRRHGREAVLEVGIDRHLNGFGHRSQVRDRLVPRDGIVAAAKRPRQSRARRGKRGKAKLFEHAGTAHVPGVGHHEAAALVQAVKLGGGIVRWTHSGDRHILLQRNDKYNSVPSGSTMCSVRAGYCASLNT